MKIGLNFFLLSMIAVKSKAEPTFVLYDADTGSLLEFLECEEVDLDDFPGLERCNIVFWRNGESASLKMDDEPERCEENRPFAFFGDAGGYDSLYSKPWDSLELGTHALIGTKHEYLSGCQDHPDDYTWQHSFEVHDSGNCPGLASFLVLYDADTQDDLHAFGDGDVICPPPNPNIEARFETCPNTRPHPLEGGPPYWEIEKVTMELTGPLSVSRTERAFPHFLWGDLFPLVYSGETLPDGSYTLKTFSASGGKKSMSQEFTFQVDCSGGGEERLGDFP